MKTFSQYATLARKGQNQMSQILSITNVSDEWMIYVHGNVNTLNVANFV